MTESPSQIIPPESINKQANQADKLATRIRELFSGKEAVNTVEDVVWELSENMQEWLNSLTPPELATAKALIEKQIGIIGVQFLQAIQTNTDPSFFERFLENFQNENIFFIAIGIPAFLLILIGIIKYNIDMRKPEEKQVIHKHHGTFFDDWF